MSLMLNAQEVPIHLAERGRVYRIGDTRVSLDTLIGAYNDGYGPEEIQIQFPTLELADIHAVISYYLHNRREVDEYLTAREQEAERTIQQIRANSKLTDIRARLLARQANDERNRSA